jgi:Holliday junction resolvase RusA-like endonuclease
LLLLVRSGVSFFVAGTPAPQGSKIPVTRGGRTVLIEASKGFKGWRDAVVLAATEARGEQAVSFTDPVSVVMIYVLSKPPSTKYVTYPGGTPDLDKLCRNTGDGLQASGLLKNDSLIVSLTGIKRWAVADEATGCYVTIENVTK